MRGLITLYIHRYSLFFEICWYDTTWISMLTFCFSLLQNVGVSTLLCAVMPLLTLVIGVIIMHQPEFNFVHQRVTHNIYITVTTEDIYPNILE